MCLLHPGKATSMTLPSGRVVDVPTYRCQFDPWTGDPSLVPVYNANPKAVVSYRGAPTFPEFAVLRELEHDGWSGVWIDNFRGRFLRAWGDPPARVDLPPAQAAVLARVPLKSGRWDIFAWRDDAIRFLELKGTWRTGRDQIRASQRRWLEAALDAEFDLPQFAPVEWIVRPVREAPLSSRA
jgi:hypothetical protein